MVGLVLNCLTDRPVKLNWLPWLTRVARYNPLNLLDKRVYELKVTLITCKLIKHSEKVKITCYGAESYIITIQGIKQ